MMQIDAERTLRHALPGVRITNVGPIVAGYQNDRFRARTDHGDLFVKVSRVRRPVGITDIQQRVSDLLREQGFPAPKPVFVGRLEADGADSETERTVEIQEFVDGTPMSDLLGAADRDLQAALFGQLGGLSAALHSIRHGASRWEDHEWRPCESWADALVPAADATHVCASDPSMAAAVLPAMRLIEAALSSQVEPDRSLAHSDLHPGNVLVDSAGAMRLIDFELAHLWDGAWDLATRLCWVIYSHHAQQQFLQPYFERAGADREEFAARVWLYTGIHLVRTAREFYDGNPVWASSVDGLRRWAAAGRSDPLAQSWLN